jgi:hypothetical protein
LGLLAHDPGSNSVVRNPHAGQPFTTSDEEIADALLDVSIPTLMLSLAHVRLKKMTNKPTVSRHPVTGSLSGPITPLGSNAMPSNAAVGHQRE